MGATLSKVITLSTLVLGAFVLTVKFIIALDGIVAMIVPGALAKTATFQVILSSVVGGAAIAPMDVPENTMSDAVKVVGSIGSLNATVKFIGLTPIGSA